jgi:hypothetical protein
MTSNLGRCFVTVNSTSGSRFFTWPPLLADALSQWIPLPEADSSHDLHFWQMLCHSEFHFRKPILHMTSTFGRCFVTVNSTSGSRFFRWPPLLADALSQWIPLQEADSSHDLHFWQMLCHSKFHFRKPILHTTSTFGRCFVTVNSTSGSRFFRWPPLLADALSQWIPLPEADSSHDLHFRLPLLLKCWGFFKQHPNSCIVVTLPSFNSCSGMFSQPQHRETALTFQHLGPD